MGRGGWGAVRQQGKEDERTVLTVSGVGAVWGTGEVKRGRKARAAEAMQREADGRVP